jgi:hypothetical protein
MLPTVSSTIPCVSTSCIVEQDRSSKHANQCRGSGKKVLTIEKASQIIRIKQLIQVGAFRSIASSAAVAREYGVSPKTVRDIWNGRTWRHVAAAIHDSSTSIDMKLPASIKQVICASYSKKM